MPKSFKIKKESDTSFQNSPKPYYIFRLTGVASFDSRVRFFFLSNPKIQTRKTFANPGLKLLPVPELPAKLLAAPMFW